MHLFSPRVARSPLSACTSLLTITPPPQNFRDDQTDNTSTIQQGEACAHPAQHNNPSLTHHLRMHHEVSHGCPAVFSGRCSQKWGLICLHHLPQPWPSQCLQLCIAHPVGWFPCTMQKEWPRAPHQPNRKHIVLGLAMAKWLHLSLTQLLS